MSFVFVPLAATSLSTDDMEDSEEEEGEARGLSVGDTSAVEGEESAAAAAAAAVRRRPSRRGTAVEEAMVVDVRESTTRGDVVKRAEMKVEGLPGGCFYKSGAPFGSGGVAAFVGEIFGTILVSGLSGSEAS
jgi:hypothetical protein